ncbi:MAG: ABC transporter ATP-binding protein/permease [Firmicutes bacterium]|nr:ABC transporter ATP-binding protein/permease [Bacillota bacterium]
MKKDIITLKWVYLQTKRFLFHLIILSLLGIMLSVLGVTFALASKNVLDAATTKNVANIVKPVIYLAVLIGLQLVFQIALSKLNIIVSGKLTMSMRSNIFKELLYKSYSHASKFHSGELINRINSDVQVITSGIVGMLPNTISLFTRIIFSFWALIVLDKAFAFICLVIGIIVLPISQIYRKRMKSLYKICQESDGKVRSFMQECIQSLLVIKSFNNEQLMVSHSDILQNNNYLHNVKRNNISIIANILFYIAVTIGFYFALAWGAYKLSIGLISFGTLTAMLQLVGQIQVPFRGLSSVIPQYYSVIASAERVIEIMELPNELSHNAKEFECKSLYHDMEEIVLENVSFSYDGAKVLCDTNLTIKKNDFIVISGSSGIGKSTFLKLLLGIITPTKGNIFIRLKTGEKINLDKNTRKLFAYVPQGNMILSGTIRENICFSDEAVNENALIASAQIAQIWGFIQSLPNKLDTVLGEKGLGLSEGEIQRIAIARAIYHNSPIILLDEATSAIDERTEAELLAAIKKLKDITCVAVSHKKAAFEICQKAAKIEKGKFKFLDVRK